MLAVLASQQVKHFEYDFVEDTNRYVAWKRNGVFFLGRIDKHGNLIPERSHQGSVQISRLPPYTYITTPTPVGESVFEFRSGMLIRGSINSEHAFIPTLGAQVLPFREYKYGPAAPRIYNLPGYYARTDKPKPEK